MMIVGLTGSIGMGKTTAARYLAGRGIPVFESDAAVHALYNGAAVPLIAREFPGVVEDGQIDREKLSAAIRQTEGGLRRIEVIVHPLVRQAQKQFLKQHGEAGAKLVVLDIPLLFETGAGALMDATVVVSAPAMVQRQRVLARPGMTEEKFQALLARQMPDAEKRSRADFVVNTDGPVDETRKQLDRIVSELEMRIGTAYERWQALD